MPDLVPGTGHLRALLLHGARDLPRCRPSASLSDDEVIILAVVASEISLARYIEPGPREADEVLDNILAILDRREVVEAVKSKMVWLLNHRPMERPGGPSGQFVESLAGLSDPDEPSADK